METDRYGYALGTASAAAAAAYRDGVDLLLSAYPGAEARFRNALDHDADFALAHAALARHLQIYQRAAEARVESAQARGLVRAASAREQAHVEILALAIDGRAASALEMLLQHLEIYPRDALPLSLAHGAFGRYAFSGQDDHDAARLALCLRLAPDYGEDWWFLTHLGWSHTEAAQLAAGARITERALGLRRANAHAAHAYAHFFAESGESARGIAFVQDWLAGYPACGTLYAHLRWHEALWRLDEGDVSAALAIYRDVLRPGVSLAPPINVVSDAASLMWRVLLRTGTTEDPRSAHEYARERYAGPAPHFIEWHLAMAAALAGRSGEVEARLESRPPSPAGAVLSTVCAALRAYAEGRYADVAMLLQPVTRDWVRLGGSGAQRRVLAETLEAARCRAAATR